MGKKFAESKAFNIILSILIAMGLWVYVTDTLSDMGESNIRNIPVTLVGEDTLNAKGLMLDQGESQLAVQTRVTGSRKILMEMAADPASYFSATVNLAEITEAGTYELPCSISISNVPFTSSVRLSDQEARTVTVTVTKLMSKPVEVRGVFTGTVEEGYRAETPEITPATVTVQGPESLVSQIAYAQVNIEGEGLTKTVSGELGFDLVTSDGAVISDDKISTNVELVSVVLPVVKTLEVPLAVDFIYGGGITEENFDRYVTCTIEPETIQVSGDAADVTSLEGKTKQIGVIDLTAVTQETQVYTFPIELSPELSNDSGITEAKVTLTIRGLETKIVETSNIDIINVPEGFTAEKVTQSLQVTVRGPADALSEIDGYQVRVVVDLEGEVLRQAQFPFTPRIYLDENENKCGVISSGKDSGGYRVVVNIQSQ